MKYYYRVYLSYGYQDCVYSSDDFNEIYTNYEECLKAAKSCEDENHFATVLEYH